MTSETNVIWQPLAGSQALLMDCPCDEILYHGTRGPGKTDAQLMFFRRYVGQGFGRFWRGIIFDREYKMLDDLIAKSQRWYPGFQDGARFLMSKADYKWIWPTGEELLFRQIKRNADYWSYHGQEFPFIGWNELSKFPTSELYDSMMSCNRSSYIPKSGRQEIPLVVLSTTNPYGAGHNWIKREWIDPAPNGVVQKKESVVFNPRTKKEQKITRSKVTIFGSWKENKYLSPTYIANLMSIKDPNKKKAWVYGAWDIVAGGALDDVWSDKLILPRFKIPLGWRVDRSFDWGSTHPFSVGWWAEADGTEATFKDGTKFCPPPKTLIRISEWYGCNPDVPNEGLKMSAKNISKGILDLEKILLDGEWIPEKPRPGPADNQIRNVNQSDTPTIEKQMAVLGVSWEKSDKAPGSRVIGLDLLRDRMQAVTDDPEAPGLYFMSNCRHSLALLPTLPRSDKNPDDVDTDSEDHLYDETRYRVLAGDRGAMTIKMGASF